jgi:hypothetical protein
VTQKKKKKKRTTGFDSGSDSKIEEKKNHEF